MENRRALSLIRVHQEQYTPKQDSKIVIAVGIHTPHSSRGCVTLTIQRELVVQDGNGDRPLPGLFLRASDLCATDSPRHFSCKASIISLHPGHYPGMMETDVGNGDTLYIDRSIFDADGNFVGVAYRQSGGCEVSVFLD